MRREMDHRGNLHLLEPTEEELAEAQAGLAALAGAAHGQAKTRADSLQSALQERMIPWKTLTSLSRWCYTEGTRKSGIEGAKRISRGLFNGQLLPRLATDQERRDIDTHVARGVMRAFLRTLEQSTPVSEADSPIRLRDNETVPVMDEPESHGNSTQLHPQPHTPDRQHRSNRACGAATHGSQYCLQRWVEEAPRELADRVLVSSLSLGLAGVEELEWKSPLASESYREYGDDFLTPLGLEQHASAVRRFWPERGPQWDALAVLTLPEKKGVLLVEAKAHPGEVYSHCRASGAMSIAQIDDAFARVRAFMGAMPSDWKRDAYQLANRLAFLYLLNEELKIPTWLALIQFVGDNSHRPTRLAEWRRAFQEPFRTLGIRSGSPLLDRVIPVWVEARSYGPSSY